MGFDCSLFAVYYLWCVIPIPLCFKKNKYCYDITDQSTCLSNVPEECRCNACGERAFDAFRGRRLVDADCVKAVSYTHLDVYKRQDVTIGNDGLTR